MRNNFLISLLFLLALGGTSCKKAATTNGEFPLRIVPYRDGDRWGFADPKGKILVEPKYESAYLMDDGYGRTYSGESTGLVSPEGKVILEPEYMYISSYSNGLAAFRTRDERSGYLDAEGKVVIAAEYEDAYDFNKDFAIVKKDSQYLLIHPDGSLIKSIGQLMPFEGEPFMLSADEMAQADPGYFLVQQPETYHMGLMDNTGNVVIPATYQSLSLPVGGVMVAQTGEKFGLMRTDGSDITPREYAYMYRMRTDRFLVQKSEDLYGLVDEKGQLVVPMEYSSISIGPGDTYIVYQNEAAGLMDKNGNKVVPIEYNAIFSSRNFLIATNKAAKTGIISSTNQVLLPFEYDNIEVLRSNRFLADKNGKRGIIDEKGKILLPFEYEITALGGDSHEFIESMDRPVNCVVLFKNGQGLLYNADGKKISDKSWMLSGYPDQFGLTYATDINGRENYIGPDGRIFSKDAPLNKVTVSSVQALYEAIDNDTEITLENGQYDLSKVKGSFEFATVYDFSEYEMEDRTLMIRDVRNLHIKAKNPGKAELIVPFAYIPVLLLENCQNTSLQGLTIGHNVQPGMCEGAVITSKNCTFLLIDNCDLYGSGTLGIEASYCSYLSLRNSVIRECTRGILDLNSCSAVSFENCTMKDNEGDHMIKLTSCYNLKFEKVQFSNNIAPDAYGPYEFFRIQDGYQPFVLKNCTFTNCSADYFATFAEALTEENTNRKGMTAAKGLWLQKESHITQYPEAVEELEAGEEE